MTHEEWVRPSGDFCLAVVLFNPETDAYIISLLEAIKAGLFPIVVDNSIGEMALQNIRTIAENNLKRHVTYIAPGSNIGLAAAYNSIVDAIQEKGDIEGIVFLDQDSIVSQESINQLLSAYKKTAREHAIGVLAGMPIRDDGRPYRVYLRRGTTAGNRELIELETAPSSFSLIPIAALQRVGKFYDDFFIDQIDRDFCYRCHRKGLRVVLEPKATFRHTVGEGSIEIGGRYIGPVSSPQRHYFQVRNLILSARRGGVPWNVALRQLIKRFSMIGVVAIVAGQGIARYCFAFRGLKDGLRNRGGPLL